MYDYMFRNALVADGSGGELFRANVAVFGDRIAFIGKEGISRARTVIDAEGLLLTPGFIDMHTHTDLEVLRSRDMKPRLHQGILTDVSGNCGIGVFPNSGECLHTAVEDVLGTYDRWSWKSFSDYRALLESEGMGINEAFLVSHTDMVDKSPSGIAGVIDPLDDQLVAPVIFRVELDGYLVECGSG